MGRGGAHLKVAFFGTPDYVIAILAALHREYDRGRIQHLVAAVTQEPKPSGRGKQVARSPVDTWAYKHSIPVVYDFDTIPHFDLGVVASYGRIIPESVIQSAKYGILNIHPSLLPRWRGASPVQATIAVGDSQTGVTVIKMDTLIDHGPIVSSFRRSVEPTDTTEVLRNRLFEESAEFIMELIPNYVSQKISLTEQNHAEATFTRLVKKADGFIPGDTIASLLQGRSVKKQLPVNFIKDFLLSPTPYNLDRFIRSMNPWPTAWTLLHLSASEGQAKQDTASLSSDSRLSGHASPKKARSRSDKSKRLKILKAHVEQDRLVLDEVQLEGKNPVSWKQFTAGYPEAKFAEQ